MRYDPPRVVLTCHHRGSPYPEMAVEAACHIEAWLRNLADLSRSLFALYLCSLHSNSMFEKSLRLNMNIAFSACSMVSQSEMVPLF